MAAEEKLAKLREEYAASMNAYGKARFAHDREEAERLSRHLYLLGKEIKAAEKEALAA